jgi:hypothetical protein
MQELLYGGWSGQVIAYVQQYPVRVVTVVLVASTVAIQVMFGKWGSGDGTDAEGFGFGDGDGGVD